MKQWNNLIRQSYERRLAPEKFTKFIIQLHQRSAVSGSKIAAAFFDRTAQVTVHQDPKIPVYIDCLLDASIIDASDILHSLFEGSQAKAQLAQQSGNVDKIAKTEPIAPQLEVKILLQLTRKFVNGSRPATPAEARSCLRWMAEWTTALVTCSSNDSMMHAIGAEVQQDQYHSALVRDALGQLLTSSLENPKMIGVTQVALGKSIRKALSQAISSFVPLWSQMNPQMASRLETAQKQLNLVDEKAEKALEEVGLDAAIQVESVMDMPVVHSRAHLYILVSSLSLGRPLTDEGLIVSYLNVLYQGDVQNLTTDLIIASFDALSGAVNRNESKDVIFSLKSFLINKIPTIVTVLATSLMPPLTAEYCITQALAQINQAAFPTFSDSFALAGGSSPLAEVRQDFVFACTRHSILPVTSVEGLLGDSLMESPPTPASRYVKEDLVAQCVSNSEKIETYMDELEKVDGNGGAIVLAITEVCSRLPFRSESRANLIPGHRKLVC